MFYMLCGAACNGYVIPCTNQLNDFFNLKYGWDTKKEQTLHQSIIGSVVVAGMAIGAFASGKLMPYGRRLTMIIVAAIGAIGSGLTLILNFYVFNFGRILVGFAAGAQGATVVRMITEYMPNKY